MIYLWILVVVKLVGLIAIIFASTKLVDWDPQEKNLFEDLIKSIVGIQKSILCSMEAMNKAAAEFNRLWSLTSAEFMENMSKAARIIRENSEAHAENAKLNRTKQSKEF